MLGWKGRGESLLFERAGGHVHQGVRLMLAWLPGIPVERLRWAGYLSIIAAIFLTWPGSFPLDDAYISLHNAQSLLAGWDYTFDTDPLVGATSPVHLALLSLFGLVLPLPLAAIVLCGIAAILYAAGLEALVVKAGARGWRIPVLVGIGLLIGTLPIQLANGLETGLAMATVAWLVALEDDRRLPLLAGLAPFIRPELGLLSAAVILRRIIGRPPAESVKIVALAMASAMPWTIWVWLVTGHPLPTTASAKIAFYADTDTPLFERLHALGFALLESKLAPLVALGSVGFLRSGGWPCKVFVAGVLGVSMTELPHSVDFNDARYLAPLMPIFVAGLAAWRRTESAIVLVAAWTLFWAPSDLHRLQSERQFDKRQLALVGQMTAPLPAGARVLIHDAGMVAWAAPRLHLVDAVGLETPSSISWHEKFTKEACAWSRALDHIAREGRVHYALILEQPFWRCIGENLAQAGWRLTPLPSSGSVYQLFRLTAPASIGERDRNKG
ncbi:hypothetical protein [Acidimangrovimonas pyrenivorans]|uniref:DUF2029 domain-containing protein n=1 Tax=Acidimangrovimonas pyrenivorans TaxID=2030798 RepID=A0ABV7AN31_9RHOB